MKIKPCKNCGSKDIEIYDCGYSSFNSGGGKCRNCGVSCHVSTLPWNPSREQLVSIWNDAQTPLIEERLKNFETKVRKLRKQLRDLDIKPIV